MEVPQWFLYFLAVAVPLSTALCAFGAGTRYGYEKGYSAAMLLFRVSRNLERKELEDSSSKIQ